jgi:uncharacterized DUF497 family protein
VRYEWDSAKDRQNIAKHGISLAAAELLFDGGERLSRDNRFEYGEYRMIARGFIAGRLFLCVFVDRGEVRRIISLRKANRREMDAYRKGI